MRSAALGLLLIVAAPAAGAEPEPADYRMDDYRAPVPETLAGATVISTEQAAALWREGRAVFVDVLPRAPKPANLPEGTIWRDKPRDTIPGAVWLPNVGYGAIAPITDRYFRDNLAAAVGNDLSRPVVFFCLDDCWMSWNAARRAVLDYGYAAVHWYPEGTDGWAFEDLPLERVEPKPFPTGG